MIKTGLISSLISRLFYYQCSRCGKNNRKPAKKITLQENKISIRICDDCLCKEMHYLIFNTEAINRATIEII